MQVQFRQGIARYQTDVLNTPTFLQNSVSGNYVDLIVSPDPTIIIFAHRTANYVVEEIRTVTQAWGPIGTITTYLYWDVNMLTGVLTRGATTQPPIYAGTPPTTPINDQHWFDTTETVMRVWNGTKWVEKIRVFAGYVTSGGIIHPYLFGTQAGINGEFEAGNIILDSYNKPLRQSDGTFVTSVTSLILNSSSKSVKFEAEIFSGMAVEPIPMFSFVRVQPGRRLSLARHTDIMSRISGVVTEDLYTNEVGNVVTDGLVRYEGWSFSDAEVNRPIFCGPNGEVTTTPPTFGVLQAAGYVYDTDAIYINVQVPIILDDYYSTLPPAFVPVIGVPVVDFTASITAGPAPLVVDFVNAVTGSPTGYAWDFTNDGTVDSNLPYATYTYSTPGIYSVKLTAANAFGSAELVKTAFIQVTPEEPEVGATNLEVRLGGPLQALRNETFQVSMTIRNDGSITATNVVRNLVLPNVAGNRITVSGLPVGSTIIEDGTRTLVTMPPIATLAPSVTYGPFTFSVTAPPSTGTVVIEASTSSPETDSELGDNTTSLSVGVLP